MADQSPVFEPREDHADAPLRDAGSLTDLGRRERLVAALGEESEHAVGVLGARGRRAEFRFGCRLELVDTDGHTYLYGASEHIGDAHTSLRPAASPDNYAVGRVADGMSEATDDPMEALVAVVAVATLPLTALAGIFLGEAAAATVAIVGWLFLVPVIAIVSDYVDVQEWLAGPSTAEATADERDDAGDDALQRLRERYAAGEIDDVEFERRLERLLETEDVEAPDHVTADDTAGRDYGRDRGRERTPEREPE